MKYIRCRRRSASNRNVTLGSLTCSEHYMERFISTSERLARGNYVYVIKGFSHYLSTSRGRGIIPFSISSFQFHCNSAFSPQVDRKEITSLQEKISSSPGLSPGSYSMYHMAGHKPTKGSVIFLLIPIYPIGPVSLLTQAIASSTRNLVSPSRDYYYAHWLSGH